MGGIATSFVNVRAWDGSAWQNLQVRTPADALTNAITAQVVVGYLMAFNGTTWDRVRCDPSKGLIVNIGGLANMAVAQVAMSATAAVIKAANTSRKAITIKNIGANPVDLGASGVTYGTGFRLNAGEALSDIRSTAAIYGICGTGLTSTVCYWEE